jgi:hypothetical protein
MWVGRAFYVVKSDLERRNDMGWVSLSSGVIIFRVVQVIITSLVGLGRVQFVQKCC